MAATSEMKWYLEGLRVLPFKGSKTKIRATVSGRLKLGSGGFIYLNGMKLVHGSKGLFLSFPAWSPKEASGKKFKDIFFLEGMPKAMVEQQVIHAYNRKQSA